VKLHDLKPAPGSRTPKRRVGRGIAAGQGKTAGRGTKGAKARAGGKIPAWFEGGQTPLHQRIPKLRGFRNPFKVEYEVVNVGDIQRVAEAGAFEAGEMPDAKSSKKGAAAVTVNQEILRNAGLVRRLDRPMKVLGGGELSTALFVVADAFSASARTKIEGAGGTVSVLETPDTKRPALGRERGGKAGAGEDKPAAAEAPAAEPPASEGPAAEAPASEGPAAEAPDEASTDESASKPQKRSGAGKGKAEAADSPSAEPASEDATTEEAATDEAPKARARKPRAAKPETDA
jgi:large subunit ribosomal protein L15